MNEINKREKIINKGFSDLAEFREIASRKGVDLAILFVVFNDMKEKIKEQSELPSEEETFTVRDYASMTTNQVTLKQIFTDIEFNRIHDLDGDSYYYEVQEDYYNIIKATFTSMQSKLDKIEEVLIDMQIEYDESGYIATTLHSDTIDEQKRKFFEPIKYILRSDDNE